MIKSTIPDFIMVISMYFISFLYYEHVMRFMDYENNLVSCVDREEQERGLIQYSDHKMSSPVDRKHIVDVHRSP